MPSSIHDLKKVHSVNGGHTVIDLNNPVTGYFRVPAQEASSIDEEFVRTPVPFNESIVLPFVFTRHLPTANSDIYMFKTGDTISNVCCLPDGEVLSTIYEGQEIQLNLFEVVFN
jgi:hypothetical protein